MWSLFTLFLILHILAVIVAFGPTFAFPLMGGMIAKNPQWALPLTEAMEKIEGRITLPVAAIVPFLGLAMIYDHHWDLWKSEWLVISIVLFTIAFFFGLLVQHPNASKLTRALREMPQGPPPEGATGPPPQIATLTAKLQRGGMLLSVLIVSLVVLMVWKPGGAFTHP
jgi:small-conductance mechanosensitive channel